MLSTLKTRLTILTCCLLLIGVVIVSAAQDCAWNITHTCIGSAVSPSPTPTS